MENTITEIGRRRYGVGGAGGRPRPRRRQPFVVVAACALLLVAADCCGRTEAATTDDAAVAGGGGAPLTSGDRASVDSSPTVVVRESSLRRASAAAITSDDDDEDADSNSEEVSTNDDDDDDHRVDRRSLWVKEFHDWFFGGGGGGGGTTPPPTTSMPLAPFTSPLASRSPTTRSPSVPTDGVVPAPPTTTSSPSSKPTTTTPTRKPTPAPETDVPTFSPEESPTTELPSMSPTHLPSKSPTHLPSKSPTKLPSKSPTAKPSTAIPTTSPETDWPTFSPVEGPTTESPTTSPTPKPSTPKPSTAIPTTSPETDLPTFSPVEGPTTESPTTSSTPKPSTPKPSTAIPTTSPETDWPTFSPVEGPTTESPTTSPTPKPSTAIPTTSPETDWPTFSPVEGPTTESPTTSPTPKPSTPKPSTAIPTTSPETDLPTFSPVEGPTTPMPSSLPTTLPSKSPIVESIYVPEYHYYPTKFRGEVWCFYGDINDKNTTRDFPRETPDLYPTLCDCCKEDHICHEGLEVECGPSTTTTTVATTGATTTAATTAAATTTTARIPSWQYYPWKFNGETLCFYGDITDEKTTTDYPRETPDLYPTYCECCEEHICHESLEAECGTLATTTTVATTAATTTASTAAATTTPGIGLATWHYYPTKFRGEIWCFYGDITDMNTTNEYPRETPDLYPTLCDCCKEDHKCHEGLEVECGTHTTTTTVATTAATTTTSTIAATTTATAIATTAATTTSPDSYFYPEIMGADTVCLNGAKSKITALANMSPEEQDSYLSSSMCECCLKHKCTVDISLSCDTTAVTTTPGTTTITTAVTTAAATTTPFTTTSATTAATTTTVAAATTTTTVITTNAATVPTPSMPTRSPTSKPTNTPDWRIYPAKFGNEAWCIFHNIEDDDFLTKYPRVTNDTYATFCECCSVHICHGPLKDECAANTTTTTVATTAAATTTSTIAATTTTTEITTIAATTTTPFTTTIATSASTTTVEATTPTTAAVTTTPGTTTITTAVTTAAATTTPVTTTSATTTVATTTATTTTPLHYFYPSRSSGGYVSCISQKPYPDNVERFGSMCECCQKHKCSYDYSWCPAHTTSTAATVTTTPAVTTNYYYPVRSGDVVICITAKPYPVGVEPIDICECCKKHGCTINMGHCDETTTTTATTVAAIPEETTAVTAATMPVNPQDETTTTVATPFIPEHYYYPIRGSGVVICVTQKPYPQNVEKYVDICECCEQQKCTINMDHCKLQMMALDSMEETSTSDFFLLGSSIAFWFPDIHADGNKCIFGEDYDSWMSTALYRASFLFDTEEECCEQHKCDPNTESRVDVVTFIDQNFDDDQQTLPWMNGGTMTHIADWGLTTSKSVSGKHSLRSGDLNSSGGKSSDIYLKIDSWFGGYIEFVYNADVGEPFDYFLFKIDGEVKLEEYSPTDEWKKFSMSMPAGLHEISFHVIALNVKLKMKRGANVAQYGSGFVYLDDLQFKPLI